MMKVINIDKQKWAGGVESLRKGYRLFGPVKEDDASYNFKELKKEELPELAYGNTKLSPKSVVFPPSEAMFTYTLDESKENHHILQDVKKDYSPRAVLGIRPCDAKAVSLVKMNFDTKEYRDPYWMNAFEATTFVGLACDTPCDTCFCTTAGCGPFNEEGLDVLLVDNGSSYIAKAMTEKGEKLLSSAGFADAGDEAPIAAKKAAAEAKVSASIVTDKLSEKVIMDLYDAPFWEEVAFSCINCCTCTYACPTCWCFDIQDENKGSEGVRMRNWDSCMTPLFTLHGSGHNPRSNKHQRVRQRFMHKLKYFLDKYQKGIMCVGCGRCVQQCPVNIDIRKVSSIMNEYVAKS
jgi:formate hydrogenlyase subunit 6/NADH:ubiquinone oxidoreductase subunit I